MPNYIHGIPEPGRHISTRIIREVKEIKEVRNTQSNVSNIDADTIAKAVLEALNKRGLSQIQTQFSENCAYKDNFDSTESLSKLADAMTISKDNKSNFEDLGEIKKVKKDSKEVNTTIDLLKNIE